MCILGIYGRDDLPLLLRCSQYGKRVKVDPKTDIMDILLFGAQAGDVYSRLHPILFQRGHSTLLASFLNRVSSALRADISQLPRDQKDKIPPLNNLLEFLERHHRLRERSAAVENVLLCICQLAQIIRWEYLIPWEYPDLNLQ